MLNSTPYFLTQYWSVGHGFNNLELTLSISQIVALYFSKIFKTFPPIISIFNFEPLLGSQYKSGGHAFSNLESALSADACIVI